jgi:hypothetical protein
VTWAKPTAAEERLLDAIFAKPSWAGKLGMWLTEDWTDDELAYNPDAMKLLIPLLKRKRLYLAMRFHQLDEFIIRHRRKAKRS